MVEKTLSKVYEPQSVEKKWYAYWLKKNYFHAIIDKKGKPFTIVIPPPNITGSLHMGHALNNVLQDIVVRKKRMEGYVTLWLPGTDHAGIATQNVVEQELAKEGLTRSDVGRKEFIKRVWKWKDKYGHKIIDQLRRLGCSCDWQRERFTLDEGCSRAVKEVFVRLFEEGLIYRGDYIINWCPRCLTALSDIEVEHHILRGHLWYIKYFFKDRGYVTIATTRPETLLGDTAVAINPNDRRYKKYVGKILILPLLGREIPIVADSYVDPSFGTGALKVTPAHDPNDFEVGKRQGLEKVNIFTDEARINENGKKYEGLTREEARKAVVKDLEKEGLLEKVEPYSHAVGHCYRCDTIVEPRLSRQWFVKMKPLVTPAIQAVKKRDVKFFPKRWEKVYFEWMENIKDWCISRQIWWGHEIPAWYCKEMKNSKCKTKEGVIVAREKPKKCPYCKGSKLTQDPDVLDTWFSSALWPFSTLGWPDKTEDLAYFYPTTLLSTAFDIIYFWVARMIIVGLRFLKNVPFKTVYFHALIRDVEGRKMSKSRGNVIDPIEVIERYGTDALRFTLASLATLGRDVYLSQERIEGYRNFANKIWNASRFALMNLEDFSFQKIEPNKLEFDLADKWILSRYAKLRAKVNREINSYHFNKAAKSLYTFFWAEFCDWYIELSKPRLYESKSKIKPARHRLTAQPLAGGNQKSKMTAQYVLYQVLEGTLRMLHPFMPFITEEIWQKLKETMKGEGRGAKANESIMIAAYPKEEKAYIDEAIERKMRLIIAVITAIRSQRAELGIAPDQNIEVLLRVSNSTRLNVLKKYFPYILGLAKVSKLTIEKDFPRPKHSAVAFEHGVEIFVPLGGLINVEKETKKLRKQLVKIEEDLAKVSKKLSNKEFLGKAPKSVVKKEKEKKEALAEKKEKLKLRLKQIR